MRTVLVLSLIGLAGCMEDATQRGCRDGIDNDGDGRIDCDDPNCNDRPFCRFGPFDTGFFDTGFDTGFDDPTGYQGPWQIATITWDCVGSGWTYEFTTDGWAYGMDLSIHETSDDVDPWSEFHFTDNLDFAEDGSWDVWGVTLTLASDQGAVVSGQTTFFECGPYSPDNLAWMVVMRGSSGQELDCGVWGFEAADWFNTQQGNSCVVFD